MVKTHPAPPSPACCAGRRRWLLGAGALALGPWAPAGAAAAEPVRWPALRLLDGSTWTAAPGRSQVVVFWSVNCPFCRRHNVHIEKLHRQTSGGRGPQILTVSRDRDAAAVRRYLEAQAYTFPVTLEHEGLSEALKARRVVPLTVLIDRQGRPLRAIPGEMFEEDVMELAVLA